MRYYILLFLLINTSLFAQENRMRPQRGMDTTKVKRGKPDKKAAETIEITIKDYAVISHARDTTHVDTTLTIAKEYKYNYLRKDNFELMSFGNVGQKYNKLGVDFQEVNVYPSIGAKARHIGYLEAEDINYYNVATPMTELFFKTTLEQGQLLDAMIAINTSPRLNFSLAYKGFRSLGKYLYNQSESSNFNSTLSYHTKNNRYALRSHIAAQGSLNEENGGLSLAEEQFGSKSTDYKDRSRIDVLFSDVRNRTLGKRYFLDHLYKLIRKTKDSTNQEKTSLAIGHQYTYETRYYEFWDDAESVYFGNSFVSDIHDQPRLKTMFNEVNAQFNNSTLGFLKASASLYNYNYFFNSTLITEDGVIPQQLKGDEVVLGAQYKNRIKGLQFGGDFKYRLVGSLSGNSLKAFANYNISENNTIKVDVHTSAKMPDFNFLLYQSEYENYNWHTKNSFEPIQVNGLNVAFNSKFWGNLSLNYTTVDNYTYFGVDESLLDENNYEHSAIKPLQETNVLNHTKVTYAKEFKLGKFALNNTVMYQNVSQANQVLNLPELVTRNTLYYSDDVFKKAMYIQTGVTLKYFSEYNMDSYNPVLGEFYMQNNQQLGGYPMLDFFINARVQQTRIYLKAEHFNAGFGSTNKHYAAPNYPYRDFVVRFGLVWNFFS